MLNELQTVIIKEKNKQEKLKQELKSKEKRKFRALQDSNKKKKAHMSVNTYAQHMMSTQTKGDYGMRLKLDQMMHQGRSKSQIDNLYTKNHDNTLIDLQAKQNTRNMFMPNGFIQSSTTNRSKNQQLRQSPVTKSSLTGLNNAKKAAQFSIYTDSFDISKLQRDFETIKKQQISLNMDLQATSRNPKNANMTVTRQTNQSNRHLRLSLQEILSQNQVSVDSEKSGSPDVFNLDLQPNLDLHRHDSQNNFINT